MSETKHPDAAPADEPLISHGANNESAESVNTAAPASAPPKPVPRWCTSWPEWFGIFGNVNVVPASDYDTLLNAVKSQLPSGMAELVLESAGLTSSGSAAQAGDKSGTAPTSSVPADVFPPSEGEREGPTPRNGDWWCPQCKEALPWNRVTYWERCDTCGTPVAVAGEGEVARLERELAAAKMLNDGHQRLATKYREQAEELARSAIRPIRKPIFPLPWHYENRGNDHNGRFGDIISGNGKPVAECVYEQDWYTISDALACSATAPSIYKDDASS